MREESRDSKCLLRETRPLARGPSLFEMSSIDAEIYLKFEISLKFNKEI